MWHRRDQGLKKKKTSHTLTNKSPLTFLHIGSGTICSSLWEFLRQPCLFSRVCQQSAHYRRLNFADHSCSLEGGAMAARSHFLDFHLARMSPVPLLTLPHLTQRRSPANVRIAQRVLIRRKITGRLMDDHAAGRLLTGVSRAPFLFAEPKKRQCKVLFDYQPQNEDELELKVGDIIDINEEVRFTYIFHKCLTSLTWSHEAPPQTLRLHTTVHLWYVFKLWRYTDGYLWWWQVRTRDVSSKEYTE